MNKDILNFILARYPKQYAKLLRWKGNANLEKIVFLNLVRDGDIVFDIGANRGYYTLLFSHIVRKKGEVHAFEPVPPTFKKLSQVIDKYQRFKNTYLNNVGISDNNSEMTIRVPDNDDGQASMAIHNFGSWASPKSITEHKCNFIRLDDYKNVNLKQLDFIKCDVEGAELLVIKGGINTLKKYSPIISLEVCLEWTRSFDYTPVDIVNILKELGYSRFYIINGHIRIIDEPEVELSEDNFSGSANMLCTIPEIHSHRINNLVDEY